MTTREALFCRPATHTFTPTCSEPVGEALRSRELTTYSTSSHCGQLDSPSRRSNRVNKSSSSHTPASQASSLHTAPAHKWINNGGWARKQVAFSPPPAKQTTVAVRAVSSAAAPALARVARCCAARLVARERDGAEARQLGRAGRLRRALARERALRPRRGGAELGLVRSSRHALRAP